MLVQGRLAHLFLLCDFHHMHIVGINVDGLIAQNKFLVSFLSISEDRYSGIANVQLVLVFYKELIIVRVAFIHLD